MSNTTNTEEILELVNQAQSKGKFDITAFAKGRAYPEDQVVSFLDVQSAYELNKLNEQMRLIVEGDELSKLEEQANKLADVVKNSKVTFHMRGINQQKIDEITAACDQKYPPKKNPLGQLEQNTDWLREWTCSLVASNLVKIENAAGEIDERKFTADDLDELRGHLPKEVWDLLVDTMQKLTLATAYFEGMTDAGFLQKS